MSSATSTLPAGWVHILDEMHMRLDHAITLADERMSHVPRLEVEGIGSAHCEEVAKWSERLQRLTDYLASAQQVVHNVDKILQTEETYLRQQIAASGSLRQKMAKGTERAIG